MQSTGSNIYSIAVGNNALFSIQSQSSICCLNSNIGSCIDSSTVLYVNFGRLGKFIGAVLLTDIGIGIIAVCRSTGHATGDFRSILLALLRLGVTAFTGFLVKFNHALSISSNAGGSQSGSNHNSTGKISFVIHITAIGQLACQSIEYCFNLITVFKINIFIIGCHGNISTGIRMLNSHITADEVSLFHAFIIVLINDGIVAAVICNIQLYITVLINKAAVSRLLAADKLINIRYAVKIIIAGLTVCRHVAVIQTVYTGGCFMGPLCAVAQPNINLACMVGACVINNTLPGRILSGQTDINTAILIYVRLIGTLRALQSDNVADNIGCFAFGSYEIFVFKGIFILAVIGINNVDVNGTAVAGHSIICFLKAAVFVSFVRRSFDFDRVTQQTDC